MNIENEIFKRHSVNFNKLEEYGFKKNNSFYLYEKEFLDNFKAIITISFNGDVTGKILDLLVNEEYLGLRLEMEGEFVGKVRDEYKKILIDIRNHCFDSNYFIFSQTNRINNYIQDKYNCNPEFLWDKFPGYAIYRNSNNNKWFCIIGNVKLSTINKKSTSNEEVEIINVKVKEQTIDNLLSQKGYYEAFHMNKKNWISIILDNTLADDVIYKWIDNSYDLINEEEYWIVPANPKYYDVINCFNNTDEIIWKQSSDIHVDDIVYLYVTEPYSKIMYKCKVIKVNIPFEYKDKNVSMNRVMKIKLLERLEKKDYSFKYLNELGIKTIRGPRKISKEIINLIN